MRDLDPTVILRSPLIWGAPLAGLVAGAGLWLLVGGAAAPSEALDALSGRGGPASRDTAVSDASATLLSMLASRPIFAETTAATPSLKVIGISRTRGRQAALVAIGGAEPAWVQVGETAEGATLVSVNNDGAVFDSAAGQIIAPLGETIDGAAATAPSSPEGGPPPGVRLPPEPAAAPRP